MSVLSQLCVDTRILRCMFWPMSRGLQKQRARWREHPGRDLGGLTTAEQRGGSQGIAGAAGSGDPPAEESPGATQASHQPHLSPAAWGSPAATSTSSHGNGDLAPHSTTRPPVK